ncbi:ubiquitin binding protein [Backusella circina FSU 941]|nr:ubiquitin binding protein [Backusella circina FSU 941]
MSWWGTSPFDEVVDKATSELLPAGQEDLVLNLDISDQIRSKKVNAKDAMRSLKRRLGHKNPNVQLATLSLVDTCVKNGGDAFVKEIASREFMDQLVSVLKAPTGCNPDVSNKALTIIQTWGLASKGKPVLSYMYDTYALLKAEGMTFPPVNQNIDSILLETSAAPEWSDSDVCDRCRTPFTITNRKHHCRKCGGTFCQQCSAKTMPLPQLGINEHVRVCDGCYMKLKLDKAITASSSTGLPKSSPSKPITTTVTTSQEQQQPQGDDFDDDMKKAIELSLKEEEQRKKSFGTGYVAPQPQTVQKSEPVEEDPDLAAAIAASLRDMEISKQNPTPQQQQQQNSNDLSSVEKENILLFSTLMDRVYATGGDVSNDTQINKLYTQIGALQPKLVKSLDETIRKRTAFVELHEKLNMAVKTYDRLLEERIASVRGGGSSNSIGAGNNSYYPYIPEQPQSAPMYPSQPLYPSPSGPSEQQYYPPSQQDYYPQTTAPVDTSYYPPPTNQPTQNYYSQDQNYYTAPPLQQQQQPQQQQHTLVEQKKPVEEANLIDL